MSDTSPRQRSTKLAHGRLVFHHPDHRSLGPQIARNEGAACDYPRCGRSRFKLGRYCVDHATNYLATGHPTARNILRHDWAPYLVVASAFVSDQLRGGHVGIEESVRWCAQELFPQGVVIRKADPRRPHRGYQAALTRCRRHGVEPVDLLTRVIAAELADDRGEAARPMFASDVHRAHQGAKLFLAAVPHGVSVYAKRRREHGTDSTAGTLRVSFRVREYCHARVTAKLGPLACRAANELRRRISTTPPATGGPVAGSSSPFINT